MVEDIITKKIADELMKMKGETRGISIKGDIDYVIDKKGKEALKKIEDEMRNLGYPIDYEKMRNMEFYPVGLEVVLFLVIKKLFNFTDREFEELGEFNSKLSLILRLFMKYFVSIESAAKAAPKIWRKLYSIGDLEMVELNKEEKYAVLRIKNFKLHPYHCLSMKGYIYSVMRMVLRGEITCEETKCPFKGDNYHEFLIKW
ncbi:MAG: hypothetical protein ACKKMP_00040 [Candidatus Nealsonbacteria bacterium]